MASGSCLGEIAHNLKYLKNSEITGGRLKRILLLVIIVFGLLLAPAVHAKYYTWYDSTYESKHHTYKKYSSYDTHYKYSYRHGYHVVHSSRYGSSVYYGSKGYTPKKYRKFKF